MASCQYCGKVADLPFTCNYCGQQLCSDHRLPENHDCPGLKGQSTTFATNSSSAIDSILGTIILVAPLVLVALYLVAISVGTGVPLIDNTATGVTDSGSDVYGTVAGWVVNATNGGTDTETSADLAGPATETANEASNTTPGSTEQDDSTIEPTLDRIGIERRVHQRVNQLRSENGHSRLNRDDQLREIARYHSEDMVQNRYFSHEAPDGETREDRYDRYGYSCRVPAGGNRYYTGGENLASVEYGSGSNESVIATRIVSGWMDSSGHRENLLREEWRREGIGVAIDRSSNVVYVTQNFC